MGDFSDRHPFSDSLEARSPRSRLWSGLSSWCLVSFPLCPLMVSSVNVQREREQESSLASLLIRTLILRGQSRILMTSSIISFQDPSPNTASLEVRALINGFGQWGAKKG